MTITDAPPAEPLTWSQFQRAYREQHGSGDPYTKIHTAYSSYLAEFDEEVYA